MNRVSANIGVPSTAASVDLQDTDREGDLRAVPLAPAQRAEQQNAEHPEPVAGAAAGFFEFIAE